MSGCQSLGSPVALPRAFLGEALGRLQDLTDCGVPVLTIACNAQIERRRGTFPYDVNREFLDISLPPKIAS